MNRLVDNSRVTTTGLIYGKTTSWHSEGSGYVSNEYQTSFLNTITNFYPIGFFRKFLGFETNLLIYLNLA